MTDQASMPPAEHVLAVYGTLRPGESNFEVMAGIDGYWYEGTVRGHRYTRRTGYYQGFPAFVADADGPLVSVAILVSAQLPASWARLDAFEGTGYRRVVVDAIADAGSGADDAPPPLRGYRVNVYEAINDD